MSKYAHTPVPRIIIYAILGVDDGGIDVVYVDKTTSSDLQKILRNHRNGKHYITAGDFQDGGCSPNPAIHILEVLRDVSPAEAFRHVLAWVRYLGENGYILLVHPKLEEKAYSMSPYTEIILQEIRKRSLKEIFDNPPAIDSEQRVYTEANSGGLSKVKLTQLNVRLDQAEKKAFDEFCAERNLTQREGFVNLLANANLEASGVLISEQREMIRNRENRIRDLEEFIARGSRGANADQRLKKVLSFQQQAVKEYLYKILPANRKEREMKILSWERHIGSFSNYRNYRYPETDGYAILKLEAMCYGHGRYSAIFIWGETADEAVPRKLRLRYYPKDDFLGIPIGRNPHSFKGALFFVAYRVVSDGAADLCAAMPMDPSMLSPIKNSLTEKQHPSLDERIRNASYLPK